MFPWLNQNAGAVQSVCAGLSVLVTVVLAVVTYHYVRLTESMSRTSLEQLRASVRPIIAVQFSFGGGREHGAEYFKDCIIVKLENVGQSALIVNRLELGWELFSAPGWVDSVVDDINGGVLVAGEHRFATAKMEPDKIPDAEHFKEFSAGLTATVSCSDLGGLVAITYKYNNACGLWIPPQAA